MAPMMAAVHAGEVIGEATLVLTRKLDLSVVSRMVLGSHAEGSAAPSDDAYPHSRLTPQAATIVRQIR
jgi:hypothetical protein